jgi:hypothetical protein
VAAAGASAVSWLLASMDSGAAGPQLELGARVGYAAPVGNVDAATGPDAPSGDSLADTVREGIPLWLDAGVRLKDRWYLGIYASYAPGWIGGALARDCGIGIACSTDDGRFGIEGHYHFRPYATLDPWIGVGAGYEWLRVTAQAQEQQTQQGANGWELANLQAGLDVRATDWAHGGPYVAVTLAEYDSDGLVGRALHGWLSAGVRVVFDVGPSSARPAPRDVVAARGPLHSRRRCARFTGRCGDGETLRPNTHSVSSPPCSILRLF